MTGIQYAGFQFYKSAGGGGKIDNFDITDKGTSVITDTFTGSGVVNGRTTTTGSLTWTSGPAVVTGGYVTDPDAIGGVPFDPTALSGNPTVVVTGAINPVTSTWGGLGFSSSAAGAYWDDGQIWALVRSNGNYAVHVLGTQVASGAIPGTPVSGFSTIRDPVQAVDPRDPGDDQRGLGLQRHPRQRPDHRLRRLPPLRGSRRQRRPGQLRGAQHLRPLTAFPSSDVLREAGARAPAFFCANGATLPG